MPNTIENVPVFLAPFSARAYFMSDERWYQCPYCRLVQKPIGLDDHMGGTFLSDNGNAELITTLQDENASFDERQFNMFKLLVTEVASQLGKRLSYMEGPSFLELSPQTMRVLLHLLEGESEKQIAGRMEISKHTVHEHVKKLHQRYEVSSRGELLSKFMAEAAVKMLRESVDDDAAGAANPPR